MGRQLSSRLLPAGFLCVVSGMAESLGSDDPRGARHRAQQRHTLVFGRPRMGLDHDAAMRIGGEAPGGGPILWDGVKAMPASGHRHLGSLSAPNGGYAGTASALNILPAGCYGAARSTTPSGTSPVVASRHNAIEQLARQSDNHGLAGGAAGIGGAPPVPLGQVRCPSGTSENARPIGSCRDAPGHCPLGPGPSPAAAAALVRRAGQTAISRNRPLIAQRRAKASWASRSAVSTPTP